ncbi:MAG: acetylxylan esterase [Verrucomicrobia bacterium]|nr:acetylxylan esterase [Verrucomicrobiota bacterium]
MSAFPPPLAHIPYSTPRRRAFVGALAFLISLQIAAAAAEDARGRHAAATNQIQRLAAEMTARCLTDVRTREDWERSAADRRRELLYMLGLDPMPPRTPLHARVTGVTKQAGFTIEAVRFESSPDLHVTGNFYVPNPAPHQAPAILYLCGHSPGPQGAKAQYQNRIQWYVEHGYCLLALDTLEFGEVPGMHHGTHNLNQWHWLSLGYTPAGTEVWNAIRALDWLETRHEVDAKRIGLTGISGGGAMTWYVAAVDERVAVAAPSCSTFTFGSQAAHWLANGQCDCIYYHNAFRWDFPTVAALIAPRPLIITSGQRDTIFPPDGYHEVYQRGKRVFDLLEGGPSERIREVDADVGHSDPPLFLAESRRWMNRWLKGDSSPVAEDAPLLKLAPEKLVAIDRFPSNAMNFSIQDQLTRPVHLQRPATSAAWTRRKESVRAHLEKHVFGWFPREPIPFETEPSSGSGGWGSLYGRYKEFTFASEPGVRVRVQWIAPPAPAEKAPLLVTVKGPGDNLYNSDFDELLPLLGRCHVIILSPRFTETDIPSKERTDIQRTSVWVGRTIEAMQVWDMMRTVEWSLKDRQLRPERIALYGRGAMSTLTLYAALFAPKVTEVILNRPSATHWNEAPALLNVLRGTDVAEVAGLLAPRGIKFVGAPGPEFELTQSIYRLEKASDQIQQARSLPGAFFR